MSNCILLKQLQVLRDARLHLMHLIPSVCAADQSCNGAVTWGWMLCVDPHDDGCTCRPLMRTSCGLPALPHNCRHSAKRPPHCSTSKPSFWPRAKQQDNCWAASLMALSTLISPGQRWRIGIVSAASIILLLLPPQTEAGCPFQNPFWFLDRSVGRSLLLSLFGSGPLWWL